MCMCLLLWKLSSALRLKYHLMQFLVRIFPSLNLTGSFQNGGWHSHNCSRWNRESRNLRGQRRRYERWRFSTLLYFATILTVDPSKPSVFNDPRVRGLVNVGTSSISAFGTEFLFLLPLIDQEIFSPPWRMLVWWYWMGRLKPLLIYLSTPSDRRLSHEGGCWFLINRLEGLWRMG